MGLTLNIKETKLMITDIIISLKTGNEDTEEVDSLLE